MSADDKMEVGVDPEEQELPEVQRHQQQLEQKCFLSVGFCCQVVLPCVACPIIISAVYFLSKSF